MKLSALHAKYCCQGQHFVCGGYCGRCQPVRRVGVLVYKIRILSSWSTRTAEASALLRHIPASPVLTAKAGAAVCVEQHQSDMHRKLTVCYWAQFLSWCRTITKITLCGFELVTLASFYSTLLKLALNLTNKMVNITLSTFEPESPFNKREYAYFTLINAIDSNSLSTGPLPNLLLSLLPKTALVPPLMIIYQVSTSMVRVYRKAFLATQFYQSPVDHLLRIYPESQRRRTSIRVHLFNAEWQYVEAINVGISWALNIYLKSILSSFKCLTMSLWQLSLELFSDCCTVH